MNCDHLYKKFEKSFHMNINLVDLFGNQFNNSLKTIGLNFYQCRFCGKVKQKKIFFKKDNIKKEYTFLKFLICFRKYFKNDDIKNLKKAKELLKHLIKRVSGDYKWK